jgi:hypothetical protein
VVTHQAGRGGRADGDADGCGLGADDPPVFGCGVGAGVTKVQASCRRLDTTAAAPD